MTAPMNAETGGGLTGEERELGLPVTGERSRWFDEHAVTTILAARVAAARADGRESLAGEIRALADEFGAIGSRTPLGQGTALDVAWCEAARRLRALVAPTGHDGETGEAG